ncbi:MAG: HEAT repeat domain-containing protein [Methanomicrobiales archaeon]|nr:HEAT repeat domain-containing protein [Methanomicrobiales archaeon]
MFNQGEMTMMLGKIFGPDVERMGSHQDLHGLIEALSHPSYSVRRDAAVELGRLADVRAVEPLKKLLADRSEEVRVAAAHALGELGDSRAIEALIRALTDRYPDLRREAEFALLKIGGTYISPFLISLKRDRADDLGTVIMDSEEVRGLAYALSLRLTRQKTTF